MIAPQRGSFQGTGSATESTAEDFKSAPSVTTLKDWWAKELVTEETKVLVAISSSRKS